MKRSSWALILGCCGLGIASAVAAPVVSTLPNGLPVITSDEPGSGRVAVVLMVRAGDGDDPPEASGASWVLARLLMEPDNHRAPGRFSEMAVEGDLQADTEQDVTTFSAITTPDRAAAAIRLLGMVIEPPVWNTTTLIRAVKREGADDREAVPTEWERDFAAWQARAGLSVAGTAPDAPPRETLRSLYEALYLPRGMALAVVGDLRGIDIGGAADKAFGALPKTADIVARRRRAADPVPRAPTGVYAFVGYPAPPVTDPLAPAMEVIAAALGNGKTSNLFRRLRESEGTGYESGAVYPRNLQRSGIVLFSRAPGQAATVRDDLAGIWKVADLTARSDWESARARAAQAYLGRHQSARDRAYWLDFWQIAGKGAAYDAIYAKAIATVADDDIHAAARRWLSGAPVSVP